MNTPHPPHFTEDQFWKAMGSAAKGAAALIAAIGVVWAALWWALQPRIDEYFDAKLSEFRAELTQMSMQLTRIENALPAPRPFIQFRSGGHLPNNRTFKPGDTVTFLYSLRRNKSCPVTVVAQFWSYEKNALASELTYSFSATRFPSSLEYGLQSLRVQLPEDMEEGAYSYAPIFSPSTEACPGERDVQVPPSEFFLIAAGG